MSIIGIALRNLTHRSVRTCFMVLFASVMAASLFMSSVIVRSVEVRLENTVSRMGADIVIVPKDAASDTVKTLFAGELSSFYFDGKEADKLLNMAGIGKASPQLFIATLDAVCCLQPTQIVAFDPKSDFIVKPWLDQLHVSELKKDEVIIGSSILAEAGEKIKFFGHDFIVAGSMAKTDTGYDNCVFMDFASARSLMESPILKNVMARKTAGMKNPISAVMIRTKEGTEAGPLATKLNYTYPDTVLKAWTRNGIFSSLSESMKQMSSYLTFLSAISFVLVILSLMCIFTITVNERRREFGIMTAIGASKAQISSVIAAEAFVIGAAGGLFGIVFSVIMLFIFKDVITVKLGVPASLFAFSAAFTALKCVGASVAVSLASSLYSVCAIVREEPVNLIREGD